MNLATLRSLPLPPFIVVRNERDRTIYINEFNSHRLDDHPADIFQREQLQKINDDSVPPNTEEESNEPSQVQIPENPFVRAPSINIEDNILFPFREIRNNFPVPQKLTFFTWWTEINAKNEFVRRLMRLTFRPDSQSVRVSLDNDDKIHMVDMSQIFGPYGIIQLTDLQIGSAIMVFGKRVTLHKADSATQRYLEYVENTVEEALDRLVAEFSKYNPGGHSLIAQLPPKRKKDATHHSCEKPTNIRAMLNHVEDMMTHVAVIRPRLAKLVVDDLRQKLYEFEA